MNILNYDIFYRRYGVRIPDQMMLPFMPSIEKFQFPRGSVHHYAHYDSVNDGPSSDEYLYRDISKKILMEHALTLKAAKGSPTVPNVSLMPFVRNFHLRNKRFRFLENAATVTKDDLLLTVVNYDILRHGARYVRNIYSDYNKWWNIQSTVWSKINEVTKNSDRQHFIFAELPKVLPSKNKLNEYSKLFTQAALTSFGGANSWFILELWKWFSEEHRAESMIPTMTQEQLAKVNIVYQESGRFLLLNLGVLNKWRFVPMAKPTTAEEKEAYDKHQKQPVKIKPDQLQARFLRMLMTLMGVRTTAPVEVPVDDDLEDNKTSSNTTVDAQAAIRPEDVDTDEVSASDRAAAILNTMEEDLAQLEEIERVSAATNNDENQDRSVSISDFSRDKNPEDIIKEQCNALADAGMMTASEYRRFMALSENYKAILSPDGKTTLAEYSDVKPEQLVIKESKKIPDIKTVVDKSMLKSSLLTFDSEYIKNVLKRDICAMVVNSQKGGFVINKYEVETNESILGKFETHTLRITPVEGEPSILRFKLPVIDEDGVYESKGIKYRMRKQRGDLPFRKTAPSRVALTTYFGKTFVTRSDKKVYDYGAWLKDQVTAKAMDQSSSDITDLVPANVFDSTFDSPRSYSSLSMGFKSFKCKGYTFNFDRNSNVFDPEIVKNYTNNKMVVVAKNDQGKHLVLDKNNALYVVNGEVLEPVGNMESFLGIDPFNAPVDFAQVKIYGKTIPVGVVLGYLYGMDNLIKMLKTQPRRVPAGQRQNLQSHEFAIQFSDETLIFSKYDDLAAMVFGGFKEYEKATKLYASHTFDKPNVYLNILESHGIGARYIKEIDLFDKLFVDPISKGILQQKGQPTSFSELLVKACESLLTDAHPDQSDMQFMRIKGYERIAGAVYSEICQTIREHSKKSTRAHQKMEMHPQAIWLKIAQDPSVTIVSEINPIKNLKEREAVTYNGVGGRTSRSMTRSTRIYHKNDMGIISESTVDSSDVAINTYMSADPIFDSLRGTARIFDIEKDGPASLMSTSGILSVASDHDDPRRVNFVAIQHEHGVACPGYRQSMVRTGYEGVIGQRTTDLFCYAAKKDGEVVSIAKEGIIIKYDDGETKGIELGRRYGNDSGLVFSHDVVTNMTVGQKFKAGSIVAYNTGFFEPDVLDPTNVVWKVGCLVDTVLFESPETHEDASTISSRLAAKLSTKTTKIKTVVVEFDKVIRDIVKPGQVVDHETVLCVIEDSITSNANLFTEDSLDTLRVLSSQTPVAKVQGVVDRIEVIYHGEKEDMSDSLRKIADQSDRELSARMRAVGKKPLTGGINEDLRVNEDSLAFESMAIRFYITTEVKAGLGDKGVFANQLKTVFSKVMDYDITTENGTKIDAVFGARSIDDRIVLSPIIIGTTNVVLELIGKEAVKAYFND